MRTDTPATAAATSLAAGRRHSQRLGYLGACSSAATETSGCMCLRVWADALSSLPVRAGICKLGLHISFLCVPFKQVQSREASLIFLAFLPDTFFLKVERRAVAAELLTRSHLSP